MRYAVVFAVSFLLTTIGMWLAALVVHGMAGTFGMDDRQAAGLWFGLVILIVYSGGFISGWRVRR